MSEAILRSVSYKPLSRSYDHDEDFLTVPLPPRKAAATVSSQQSLQSKLEIDFPSPVEFKAAVRKAKSETTHDVTHRDKAQASYPAELIRAFKAGVVVITIGIVLIVVAIFLANRPVNVAGAALFVIGSLVAVFALLRGQELDECSE